MMSRRVPENAYELRKSGLEELVSHTGTTITNDADTRSC